MSPLRGALPSITGKKWARTPFATAAMRLLEAAIDVAVIALSLGPSRWDADITSTRTLR